MFEFNHLIPTSFPPLWSTFHCKKKKKYEIASCHLYNCFDSLRCLSIKDISQLKDRVNNYIPLLSGLFISNEAASSQRESIKSPLNNINRENNHVKISVPMGTGWEHRQLKSVVLGWRDYVELFFLFKIFFDIVLMLLYNKHQKGNYRNIEKTPEADAFWPEPRACRAQIFASYSYSIGLILAWVPRLHTLGYGTCFLRGLLSTS